MPAVSEKQRRLFLMAQALQKKGLGRIGTGPAAKIARTVPAQSIQHFTGPVKKDK